MENNKETAIFFESMIELERHVQEYAKENMKDWFESNNVDLRYKSCIMEKRPYSPLLKTRVMLDTKGEYKMSVYNGHYTVFLLYGSRCNTLIIHNIVLRHPQHMEKI
jgi:hypothetical protein